MELDCVFLHPWVHVLCTVLPQPASFTTTTLQSLPGPLGAEPESNMDTHASFFGGDLTTITNKVFRIITWARLRKPC